MAKNTGTEKFNFCQVSKCDFPCGNNLAKVTKIFLHPPVMLPFSPHTKHKEYEEFYNLVVGPTMPLWTKSVSPSAAPRIPGE
jgi:hypothetical protein